MMAILLQLFIMAIIILNLNILNILCLIINKEHVVKQSSMALKFILIHENETDPLFDIIYERDGQNVLQTYSNLLLMDESIQRNYPTFIVQASAIHFCANISETTLRGRWKAAKWRLRQSIIVSSESLDFASKVLLLYGPNTSETDSIYVSMSQASFDAQNGSLKFQRDILYRKMYPRLVLLTNVDIDIKVQIICILCPNALSSPAIEVKEFQNMTSVSSFIKSTHKELNSNNGHGSEARLCQVGFRGDVIDTKFHKHLEFTARWRYDKRADKVGVILGILINRFNFTLERGRESWLELQGNYSGIYLNPGGDMPEKYIYGRQLTLSYIISEFLMYCRKVPVISSTGWDFLWAPFDNVTWGFIFITGVVLTVYHRGHVSYGLDIFWGVLGVPSTSDWTKNKLLACCLVVLLNLNIGYLSVITSKVIIPNRESDIATPAELFQQGFRFISGNVSEEGNNFINYWGKYLEAAKVNTSALSRVLVQVDSCIHTHSPICISNWTSLATGVVYAHKKTEFLLDVPANIRDRCHGVKKPIRAYWVSFYSQGPLSSIFYTTYQALIATGIDSFWENLQKTSSSYVAHRKANHTRSESSDPPKLNFETPILVVFKAYGVLIAICIFSFPMERLYFYAVTTRKLMLVEPSEGNRNVNEPRIIVISNFGNDTRTGDKQMMQPRVQVLW